MCGLVALFKQKELPLPLSQASTMMGKVAHRGPDGSGIIGLEGHVVTRFPESTAWQVALGHKRLSIIDLSPASGQPMVYRNRYWLTYNGEVYNYLELRSELQHLGHVFSTKSDSEVVLAAFAEWGPRCFERMRGMWGLVIIDARTDTAVLCRDRLGIKPLYLWRSEALVAVVSELKQLLELPYFYARRSEEAVDEFLATGYENPNRTFFSGVAPIPAGNYMTLSISSKRLSPPEVYWWPERINVRVNDAREASNAFTEKLIECVKLQLRSDVPLGCTLSGGLDSSAIATLVHRQQGKETNLHTFTSNCVGEPRDERKHVDVLLGDIRPTAHFITPSPQSFVEDLDDFVWHHEEPVVSLSMYAAYCVAQAARAAKVPVILNGEGGDEVLSGYWQSYFMYLRELALCGRGWTLARHIIGAALPDGNSSLLGQIPVMMRRYIDRSKRVFLAARRKPVASEILQYALQSRGQARRVNEIRHMYLPRLLKWNDRNSMAFSIEGRFPFLDHELIELCLSFTPETLYYRGWTKWPLRQGLQNVIPEQVLKRRSKYGFWVPQDHWLCDSLRPFLTKWLTSERPLWSIVDRTTVQNLADKTWKISGRHDGPGQALVRCFFLDKWLEIFSIP
jgi:asparagine synthase (glutamine-hydrolysing)